MGSVDDFDFSRFHRISEGFTRGALRVRLSLEDVDPFALTRGEHIPTEPLKCECDEGSRPLDLIGTTSAVLYVVSDRVTEALHENGFTGWSTYPVEIGCMGTKIRGYQGFAAVGRCGPARHEDVVLPPLGPGGEAVQGWRGLYFDPATWDGSDIFSPDSTAFVVVTDDVKRALEELDVENFEFEVITEWELPKIRD